MAEHWDYTEGESVYKASATDKTGGQNIVTHYHEYQLVSGEWQLGRSNIKASDVEQSKIVNELPDTSIALDPNDPESQLSIGERGLGMGDVTAKDMLGKSEDEMLKWIIDTRYGGKLPTNVTENDILTQIRTKLPQKGGITGTDWYGLQGVAQDTTAAAQSVYGGMGTGVRGQIAGQQQIGKDIYALEEGKGKEWTSKFRTFLSSLPTATGT